MGLQLYDWARSTLACCLADPVSARHYAQETLQLALQEQNVTIEIVLMPIAAYTLAATQPARAVQFLAWVNASPDSATLWVQQWRIADTLQTDLRKQLGTKAIDIEWERGASLKWKTVLALLIEEFQAATKDAKDFQPLSEPLTPRETEVLQLLAAGLTNPQIAERLVIGAGTVKTHTLNILWQAPRQQSHAGNPSCAETGTPGLSLSKLYRAHDQTLPFGR